MIDAQVLIGAIESAGMVPARTMRMVKHWFAGLVAVGVLYAHPTLAGVWPNGVQNNGIQNNGIQNNGIQNNGIQNNGIQNNGIQNNGIQNNGIQNNGVTTSGVTYNGISVLGSQLSYIGQGTSAYAYSCAHREDVTGAALNNCSPCSMTVANVDSYCKTNYWDSICVNRAKAMCTLGAGSTITATLSNGSTARMRIDSVTQGSSSFWNGTAYTNMSDVYYNNVSWVLDHAPNVVGARLLAGANSCTNQVCNLGGAGYAADPYCCNNSWDSYCVQEANAMCGAPTNTTAPSSTQGRSVCGETGSGAAATPIQAMFLAGWWDNNRGAQGNGGKHASSSTFHITCRGVGATAKCVDMGYKPWISTAFDQLHQACVRMVRADYCGDGNSFTTTGSPIDVEDYFRRSSSTSDDLQYYATNSQSGWFYEASWDVGGANFLDFGRDGTYYAPSAYDGQQLNLYMQSRSSYCRIEVPWSGPTNAQADGTVNLLTNRSQAR